LTLIKINSLVDNLNYYLVYATEFLPLILLNYKLLYLLKKLILFIFKLIKLFI